MALSRLIIPLLFSRARAQRQCFSQYAVCSHLENLLRSLEIQNSLRVCCYFSGFALDRIDNKMRKLIMRLIDFHQKKQIEIIDGLYYEPDIRSLEPSDVHRQLKYMHRFWKQYDIGTLQTFYLGNNQLTSSLAEKLSKYEVRYILCDRIIQDKDENFKPYSINSIDNFPLVLVTQNIHHSLEHSAFNKELSNLINLRASQSNHSMPVIIPNLDVILGMFADSFSRYEEEVNLSKFLHNECSCIQSLTSLFRQLDFYNIYSLAPKLDLNTYQHKSAILAHARISRREQIKAQLDSLGKSYAHLSAEQESLNRAWKCFDQSFFTFQPLFGDLPALTFQKTQNRMQCLLYSQVELDSLKHPNTDPLIGWIEHSTTKDSEQNLREISVSNPFINLSFSAESGGSIIIAEYKARKVDLLNSLDPNEPLYAFSGRLLHKKNWREKVAVHDKPVIGKLQVMRVSPDILILRGTQLLSTPASPQNQKNTNPITFCKDFLIKSTLGGHLANSSYGLTMNYWLEGQESIFPNFFIAVESVFTLPSAYIDSQRARPLLCVGAESEQTVLLNSNCLLKSSNFPGGLYGIRLIDGITSFIIDIRSSKQLDSIMLSPINQIKSEDQEFDLASIKVVLVSEAHQIRDMDHQNSIFVSVV